MTWKKWHPLSPTTWSPYNFRFFCVNNTAVITFSLRLAFTKFELPADITNLHYDKYSINKLHFQFFLASGRVIHLPGHAQAAEAVTGRPPLPWYFRAVSLHPASPLQEAMQAQDAGGEALPGKGEDAQDAPATCDGTEVPG